MYYSDHCWLEASKLTGEGVEGEEKIKFVIIPQVGE